MSGDAPWHELMTPTQIQQVRLWWEDGMNIRNIHLALMRDLTFVSENSLKLMLEPEHQVVPPAVFKGRW